jgi:hypothetical protein
LRQSARRLFQLRPADLPVGFIPKWMVMAICLILGATPVRAGRDHSEPGAGYVREFPAALDDVLQALQEDLQDQIIHGTQVFEREPTLTGAAVVPSTPVFPPWKGEGKVFYKVRTEAIAPRHFLESADRGTIAVRYVVTSVSPERTRLRIDAIFVETAHRAVHPSDGTVELSEYKVIQDHLQANQLAAQEAAETTRRRDGAELARQTLLREREDETTRLDAARSSAKDLEQRVNSLRHEVERRVKAPGGSLKAAPFGSAANLANLPAFTEVVVVIVTAHWYGVETPSGLRGWLPSDQLELLP